MTQTHRAIALVPDANHISRRRAVRCLLGGAIAAAGLATSQAAHRAAASGLIGYVATASAPLMVYPTDLSVQLWMEVGTPVDILFGPYEGMYEIRYYGTDGWIWAEDLSFDSAPADAWSASADAAPAAVTTEERWIDVDRTSGLVRLMIGDIAQAGFWGSLGYDTSASGYNATAIGTYFIYQFDRSLHFSDLAGVYISHWVGFDPERFNGFHSYSKDADGTILPNGAGNTAGCVALAPGDIDTLYDFAEMGMRVEIHF